MLNVNTIGSVFYRILILLKNELTLIRSIYITILVLTIASCATDRSFVNNSERFKVSEVVSNYFSPSLSEQAFAMDSTLYDKLIEKGSSDFCAMVASFSMSDVVLDRQLPNRCHLQRYNFSSCKAEIYDDTVTVIFRTQDLRRSVASNKLLKVKIHENDHTSEIIHWGTAMREITKIDGSREMNYSPSSEIINTKLKLNKKYFEIGDTIIGELKISSYQLKGKRKTKIKEEAFGKFRTIIGGYGLDCDVKESLATSWLKD